MVVVIRRLIWKPKNVKHIARHGVSLNEVEEVTRRFNVPKSAPQKRLILIGETDAGRILELVLVPKGKGRYYPLTAYDASPAMAAMYKRRKGVKER